MVRTRLVDGLANWDSVEVGPKDKAHGLEEYQY
jgi:hypothetical protein